jgi:hypothetical protein
LQGEQGGSFSRFAVRPRATDLVGRSRARRSASTLERRKKDEGNLLQKAAKIMNIRLSAEQYGTGLPAALKMTAQHPGAILQIHTFATFQISCANFCRRPTERARLPATFHRDPADRIIVSTAQGTRHTAVHARSKNSGCQTHQKMGDVDFIR